MSRPAEFVAMADALMVVDVQKALMSGPHAVPDHVRLEKAIRVLLERARFTGVPIIFLQNDGDLGSPDEPGQPGWELFFELHDGDLVLAKDKNDGFDGTGLDAVLTKHRVFSVAICGLLSEMCVAATARAAMQRGYRVLIPHDAHATYDVPPGPGGLEMVPAKLAARAAEWSLGERAIIVPSAVALDFSPSDYALFDMADFESNITMSG
jgi:nicotinamidase-related amidase